MIELYEGKMGSGKTLSAVQRILEYLAAGGQVSTNIELKVPACQQYCLDTFGVVFSCFSLIIFERGKVAEFFHHVPSGTPEKPGLVVVDEAQEFFNARDWKKQGREFLSFLWQSRKLCVDIIFISQHCNNLDKQAVRLLQYIWAHRNMRSWIMPGLGLHWPLPQILRCQYDFNGRDLLQKKWWWIDKRLFKCYDTYQLVRKINLPVRCGTGVQTVTGWPRRLKVKIVVLGAIIVCFGLFWATPRIYRMFHPVRAQVGAMKPVLAAGPARAASAPARERPVPALVRPGAYRQVGGQYQGYVWESGGGRWVVLADNGVVTEYGRRVGVVVAR